MNGEHGDDQDLRARLREHYANEITEIERTSAPPESVVHASASREVEPARLRERTARRTAVSCFSRFLWEHKIWWITPAALVIVVLLTFIIVRGGGQIAPFVYSLF